MRLYATVTSERASKGQGGNDFLEIAIKAFDRETVVGDILVQVVDDADGKPTQYLISWRAIEDSGYTILKEGHETEGTIQRIKGEKQKDI